jgi:hypothetical protein
MTPQTDPLRVALGSRLDLGTRLMWRTVGRPIDPASNHRWLDSPHRDWTETSEYRVRTCGRYRQGT